MDAAIYKNTQVSFWALSLGVAALVPVALLLWYSIRWARSYGSTPAPGVFAATLVILSVLVAIFSTLTVEISHGWLEWAFGLGLFGGRVRVAEIEAVEQISPMPLGMGIRVSRAGITYSVGASRGLRIQTRGRTFILATDDTERLIDAINQTRARD